MIAISQSCVVAFGELKSNAEKVAERFVNLRGGCIPYKNGRLREPLIMHVLITRAGRLQEWS